MLQIGGTNVQFIVRIHFIFRAAQKFIGPTGPLQHARASDNPPITWLPCPETLNTRSRLSGQPQVADPSV
jgi:hypothetical protein